MTSKPSSVRPRMVLHALACVAAVLTAGAAAKAAGPEPSLEEGFRRPPRAAGVRCYWWWLNGNVTRETITRDLEAMHEKGFSGALIFDAGGAEQRGNRQVPEGPLFGSPAWLGLFTFAVEEAARLDLELSLSIQSGWNLGGPTVTPEQSSKMLVWSETPVTGPAALATPLPAPPRRHGYYEDVAVVAMPRRPAPAAGRVRASSAQTGHEVGRALDGRADTFWVSGTSTAGQGPAEDRPQWIEFEFDAPVEVHGLQVQGRPGYGPKLAHLQAWEGDAYRTLQPLRPRDGEDLRIEIEPVRSTRFRLLVTDAYDANAPQPRNVQVARMHLFDRHGRALGPVTVGHRPIRDLQHKTMVHLLHFAAADSRPLLDDVPGEEGEAVARAAEIVDLTDRVDADGVLRWEAPEGEWTVLRFGCTATGAHVSTASGRWQGLAIDYMDPAATRRYWDEVVEPILATVKPHLGTALRHLHTDSWECGGANWTPGLRELFQRQRGYELRSHLPVIAGHIIDDREASNRFLADFRKTLADAMAGHYELFAELAARHGLGTHPESGGPHAGPFDGLRNLGRAEIPMGEFWVPSAHRPTPQHRFYVKQASSAAHLYGRRFVAAEGFTSIGPHWNDVPWSSMKPSFDHELCSGLNLLFIHTFTASPPELGRPGQEYFAGTHFNPNLTWWDQAQPFMDYLHRCQFLMQQGGFQADVLYYAGDHIPLLIPHKGADPAGALPGYDYDVVTEEILLRDATVRKGRIEFPTGMSYRLLVLPDHRVLSLAVLRKVDELARAGAAVLGHKPERTVSLTGQPAADDEFARLADALWGSAPEETGSRRHGDGLVMWGRPAREALAEIGLAPDLEFDAPAGTFDFIHRTIDGREVYFISNQRPESVTAKAIFRVSGRRPELWNPLTGEIHPAAAFRPRDGRTELPLEFPPHGSLFVVFHEPIPETAEGAAARNAPVWEPAGAIEGPWTVAFSPAWGGPETTDFPELKSWTDHSLPGVQAYSGVAVYRKTVRMQNTANNAHALDLGRVEDLGIARVRLNGRDLGTVWTPPFRVELGDAARDGDNELVILVVNSWRNRLIADRRLPEADRLTWTNITVTDQWKPQPSGLLGPVTLLRMKR